MNGEYSIAHEHRKPPSTLSITIKNRNVLYAAYMPYIRGGGLFIPTTHNYQMGDEIFMQIALMNEPEKFLLSGKVVWITPPGAQGNRQQGIGVQFENGDRGKAVRDKIDSILGNAIQSNRPTHTM